jgi:twitching motility protein PilT
MSVLKTFENLFALAVEHGASDIHIKSNRPAFLRLHGHLEAVEMDPLPPAHIREFIEQTVPENFYDRWRQEGQVDYSYRLELVGRFRVNAFMQRGVPGVVMRHVKANPPTFSELNLESTALEALTLHREGIVLVCGATGSGKSTTLAAMINHINQTRDSHIVTLEDPIEYTYTDNRSIINQREIGIDCANFASGMKSVLRQDPDVILVGEMRDPDTFETALQAAETGHLVLGTLHAANGQQAVQRLFEVFPPERREALQKQIAGSLRAIITQKLLPALEGDGRIPASEVFIVDALGRRMISDGQLDRIEEVIGASTDNGSKTFNHDLHRLIKAGQIAKDDALSASPNRQQLEMNLRGIFLSSGGIIN